MTQARLMKLTHVAVIYAAIGLAVAGNAIGLYTIVIDHGRAFDWDIYVEAARRFPLGTLYEWHHPYFYRYTPLFAPILGMLTWFGLPAWRFAHFLALAVLPSRRLSLLLLISFPFWFDVVTGNLMVFVLVAAAWAYRGNNLATAAYLALCVLVPRPIMLPLLAWLLWQRPAWRVPFIGIAALVVLTAIPTGYLPEWIGSLFKSGADEIANDYNLSPSHLIGAAWLLIGVPMSTWLTFRGRLGWASMAISPYLLPYYLQMLGLEMLRPAGDGGPSSGRRLEGS